MIFDIISSRVNVSKWQDRPGSVSVTYDVVPNGSEYLDIGDDYILCAAGYLPMADDQRVPVEASVTISSDPAQIAHVTGERPFVGYAQFSPARERDFESQPAKLWIQIVVERERFDEILQLRIGSPASATLHTQIEGLSFGWEPDGSHQIWDLSDTSDSELGQRRRITSFWINIETFWTHEKAIGDARDARQHTLWAHSSDERERKLVADLAPEKTPDPVLRLLRHCRTLLILLVGIALLALFAGR